MISHRALPDGVPVFDSDGRHVGVVDQPMEDPVTGIFEGIVVHTRPLPGRHLFADHEQIVDLQIDSVRRRLTDRQLELEVTEPAKAYLAREGYDPVYGARPLRRFIQREVETRIGRALIGGNILDGSTIVVDVDDDDLVISWRPAGQEAPVGAAA